MTIDHTIEELHHLLFALGLELSLRATSDARKQKGPNVAARAKCPIFGT
jgi:hypothetical protein